MFTAVGAGLNVVFGKVLTGTSAILGLHYSAALMSAGLTLGALVTPIASILSGIADKVTDSWASWHKGGPFTYLISYFGNEKAGGYIPLTESKKPNNTNSDTFTPSLDVQNTIESAIHSDANANQAVVATDGSSKRVNTVDPKSKVPTTSDAGAQHGDDSEIDPNTGEPLPEL